MGCCKQPAPNRSQELEGVPDSTFMCLARMAYELTSAAEAFYTGRERPPWVQLSDEECIVFATKVRRMVKGLPPESVDPLDQLSFRLLHSIVAHV